MSKQEAGSEGAAGGGYGGTIAAKHDRWIARTLATIKKLSNNAQLRGIELLQHNFAAEAKQGRAESRASKSRNREPIKSHPGGKAIRERSSKGNRLSVAELKPPQEIWLRAGLADRLARTEKRVSLSAITGEERASRLPAGGQKASAIETLARSRMLIESSASALWQWKVRGRVKDYASSQPLASAVIFESYKQRASKAGDPATSRVKLELKGPAIERESGNESIFRRPTNPEVPKVLLLWAEKYSPKAKRFATVLEERSELPGTRVAAPIVRRPTVLDGIEASPSFRRITATKRDELSGYKSEPVGPIAPSREPRAIRRRSESKKAQGVEGSSQTLNYSPTVIINASLADRDIERKVLAGLLGHGRELSELMRREAARQRRTEF